MTTITISYDVSDKKIKEIQALLTHEETHNINFNGKSFSIDRGDFTCIEDEEGGEYVKLLNDIRDIIAA